MNQGTIVSIFQVLLLATALIGSPQVSQAGIQNEPGGAISGTVVRTGSGERIPYAQVRLFKVSEGADTSALAETTDADGQFQFRGLDAGTYRIDAARNGFVKQEGTQAPSSSADVTVQISSSQQVRRVLLPLTPTATLTGRRRVCSPRCSEDPR